MVGTIKMTSSGAVCLTGSRTIHLDPKRAQKSGINFVSHAHFDHLPSSSSGTILTSFETRMLADMRGVKMDSHTESVSGITLVDTGHILGSKGLLADDVFYTGDISVRDRGFLKGARVPKCKALITECTFGMPEFVFPPLDRVVSEVNRLISELYAKGKPVIMTGYKLGKAQMLAELFDHWEPLYYHDEIKEVNDLHRGLGIPLKDAMGHTEAEKRGLLDKKPWVMIAPPQSRRSGFVQRMKERYGAVTIGFSGWAKSTKFAFGRGCDISIPLSDHCDFNDLMRVIIDSGAEKIYTVHGFVNEFASHLQRLGFDAQPLRKDCLENFA